MTAARLGLRLARRELARRPWRTALVVLMVLLPTATMAVVVIVMRTGDQTAAEEAATSHGSADVVGNPLSGRLATDDELDDLRTTLPDGAMVAIEERVGERMASDDRRSHGDLSNLPLDSPVVAGRFADVDGRLPADDHEVVLTEPMADQLDVEVGDTVRSSLLDEGFVVVGTVVPRRSTATSQHSSADRSSSGPARRGRGSTCPGSRPRRRRPPPSPSGDGASGTSSPRRERTPRAGSGATSVAVSGSSS